MDHKLILGSMAKRMAVPADSTWLRVLLPSGAIGTYLLLRGGDVIYVGRSDHCLLARLTGHGLLAEATHVCWDLCRSPEHAFHMEAYWYDRLKAGGSLLNLVHPARPAGDARLCPFCALDSQKIRAALPFGGRGLFAENSEKGSSRSP
jgi:hypothetical protein